MTISSLAKGCKLHGVDSEVLSLARDTSECVVELDGHLAHKAKMSFEIASTGFSLDAIKKFKRLSADVDIVNYHFPWPFMDFVHLLKLNDKPSVVTYHSDIVKQKRLFLLYQPVMRRFLNSVSRIVTTSENYLLTSKALAEFRHKCEVIPLGLDRDDYPAAPSLTMAKWKRRFNKPFFLFVGVLRYYKGIQYLIDAAMRVDADVVIVGSGPMEADLRRQADRAISTNVHFLGALPDTDKSALLELCTAFVFPSHLRSEAYGLSLVEAAMFGKPMISCEIGTGTSFVNVDKVTGLIVPPENPVALAVAMNTLLADVDTAALYGRNALERYEVELRASVMSARYSALYASILTDG